MAQGKKCTCGYVHTGWDACVTDPNQISKIALIKLVADDGSLNRIDTTATIDSAYFTSLVNHSDLSKKAYVIENLTEVTYTNKDVRNKTLKDNTNINIEKFGTFTFEGTVQGMPTQVVGALNSSFCFGFGAYYIGIDGAIIGRDNGDGFFYPKRIQNETLVFKNSNSKGGDDINMGMLMFEESRTENLKNYAVIVPEEGATDALVGIKEVVVSISTTKPQTATTLTVDANLLYGALNSPIDYDVADVAQWTLTDITNGASVAITSVVLDVDCDLVITHEGGAPSDNFSLAFNATGFYAQDITGSFV